MSFPELPDYTPDDSPKISSVPKDAERFEQARRSAQRLYLILLAIGLSIGVITSVGIVSLLQRFGLTEVPNQIEQN